jgi:hypothetical protein
MSSACKVTRLSSTAYRVAGSCPSLTLRAKRRWEQSHQYVAQQFNTKPYGAENDDKQREYPETLSDFGNPTASPNPIDASRGGAQDDDKSAEALTEYNPGDGTVGAATPSSFAMQNELSLSGSMKSCSKYRPDA